MKGFTSVSHARAFKHTSTEPFRFWADAATVAVQAALGKAEGGGVWGGAAEAAAVPTGYAAVEACYRAAGRTGLHLAHPCFHARKK